MSEALGPERPRAQAKPAPRLWIVFIVDGVTTLRVGLQGDLHNSIDAPLSDLAHLLELVADINL